MNKEIKRLQINILAHNTDRILFTEKSISQIKKIKNKVGIHVVICFSNISESHIWRDKSDELCDSGISANSICIDEIDLSGNNYMGKIKHIVNSDFKYSCSMDDDILMSSHLWDYIIENLEVLDSKSNLFIAPLISNGIPSVDLFIEDFCNSDEKTTLHDIFINTKIENLWGANYESLNKGRDKWDLDFYDDVRKIDHYYKGIHPVRVSIEAHSKLAEFICKNPKKLLEKNNYSMEIIKFPYFCNSFYFIKTEVWKKIISDYSLFKDPYDEVPLNLYMEQYNLDMVFVRKGFCLHMAYNTINTEHLNNQKQIENYYTNNLLNKI